MTSKICVFPKRVIHDTCEIFFSGVNMLVHPVAITTNTCCQFCTGGQLCVSCEQFAPYYDCFYIMYKF